jgi:hypothetical protein
MVLILLTSCLAKKTAQDRVAWGWRDGEPLLPYKGKKIGLL